ncbi:unnamed protein product [Paramecium octaurelia]|uniref:Transmembrane protein n=1 Tax=Paramecium octaurelia TaxID=43137 RepID=A0A8S1T5U7_PAROT|nr:unnamed protein product [Paramecium octaurelia]
MDQSLIRMYCIKIIINILFRLYLQTTIFTYIIYNYTQLRYEQYEYNHLIYCITFRTSTFDLGSLIFFGSCKQYLIIKYFNGSITIKSNSKLGRYSINHYKLSQLRNIMSQIIIPMLDIQKTIQTYFNF